MAKKQTSKPMQATQDAKATKPVRLDVPVEEIDRVQAAAKRLGLSMSAYARMALYERLERDEKR